MLDSLRSARTNIVLQVVIVAIILSFVFWIGYGGMGTGEVTEFAVINGERVTDIEYNRALNNTVQDFSRRAGQNLTPEMEAMIREQVRDQLITSVLLRQEAERMGLVVSDRELADRIKEIPGFQDEQGRFKKDVYEAYFKQDPFFETNLRKGMLVEKMQKLVTDAVQLSDAELKGRFLAESEEVDLSFVRISKLAFEQLAEVTEAEAAAALADRKEEIAAAYERDKAFKYDLQKKAKARHILRKVAEGATPEEDAAAKAAAEGLLAQYRAAPSVETFAALATANSEDPGSAVQGGDLGFFEARRMDKAFADATFALQPGQVSEVVKSSFGYHIILLEEFQEARLVSLEEAQPEIARELVRKDKASQLAEEFAKQVQEAWQRGDDIQPMLLERELTVQRTGPFTRTAGRIPRLGASGEVVETVFALETSAPFPTAPVTVPGGFAVVKLEEKRAADLARFDEEKDALRRRYLAEKQQKVVTAWIDRLKADAKMTIAPLS